MTMSLSKADAEPLIRACSSKPLERLGAMRDWKCASFDSSHRRTAMASVRYIVTDVDRSLEFYRDLLGFTVDMHNPAKFAALKRDDLTLYLSAPGAGSGGTAGGKPEPGGWNRFMLVTDDVDALIDRLTDAKARFKGAMSEAGAGRARLVEDPSGNLIELFEFKKK
jgi:catechol 2,3-dioxygenase-like lactoylglutathione lyase family enzyme